MNSLEHFSSYTFAFEPIYRKHQKALHFTLLVNYAYRLTAVVAVKFVMPDMIDLGLVKFYYCE